MELQELFSNSDKSILLIYHPQKSYFILQGVGNLSPKELQKVFVRFRVQSKKKGSNKLLINFHDIEYFGTMQFINLFANYLSKSAKQGGLVLALMVSNPESYSNTLMKITGYLSHIKFQLFDKIKEAEEWLLVQEIAEVSTPESEDIEEGRGEVNHDTDKTKAVEDSDTSGVEYFKEKSDAKSKEKPTKKEKELRAFSLGKGVKVKFKIVNENKKWWQYFLE